MTTLFSLFSPKFSIDNKPISTDSEPKDPAFLNAGKEWVDSVFNTLSPDERIAQLLMIPAYSNRIATHQQQIEEMITKYKVGGIIFMQGGPHRQIKLLNRYQEISKVPLLISMDAEWSLSMRLDSTVMYPRQLMLGAIQDNNLMYEMGVEFARQLKRTGVHVNFAPVVDINNNSQNPVINYRSFGEDKMNVMLKAHLYSKGMEDNRILSTMKHFPGHGDTDTDSHKSLPVINLDNARLDSIELAPFRYMTNKGVGCAIVSHLFVPAIDSTPDMPATLSPKAIDSLLKKDIGFKGLIFTDAMNMGGITNYYKPGKADVMALIAGNDVIVFPNEIPLVMSEIKKAIAEGLITQEELDLRCKKVLHAKYWVGLNEFKPISHKNLYDDLNNTNAKWLQQKLIENAITLVKNQDSIIPLKNLDTLKIASISFGKSSKTFFQTRLDYYADVTDYVYDTEISKHGKSGLIKMLSKYDVVIASVHNTNRVVSRKYGIKQTTVDFIDELSLSANVILDVFANPYSLDFFKNADKMAAVIVSYNDWKITNDFSAQLIFGGIPAKGRLPVTASEIFPVGTGVDTEKIRLKYTNIPEDAGVSSHSLYKVDSIFKHALHREAFPGGQIVASRNEIVFYQKSFGYHTYEKKNKVDNLDIYDLASVTKVSGTAAALMLLYDRNAYELDDKLSEHLDMVSASNKENMTFRNILTHRAGLKSWIPFYLKSIETPEKIAEVYDTTKTETHTIQIADKLFINEDYLDTIYHRICTSSLNAHGRYIYSDLGYYLFQKFIEEKTDKCLPTFLEQEFYASIGAWTLGYNPLNKFNKDDIVPTEIDDYFRHQLLHGHVHDQGAAMLGGVCGHAGLFASANDVLKIFQMYLNNGKYGNIQYIKPETIETFTSYQFNPRENRRGLAFDKKYVGDDKKLGIGSESASAKGFGHSGYTGTMAWADPEYDFVFVFNSNRNHPTSKNNAITKLDVRTKIEEVFYQSIISYEASQEKETIFEL